MEKSARGILIDVSRLVWRAWGGRLPTGIDRTCLAYVAHYRDAAQAVVQRGGLTRVLSVEASHKLFDVLLKGGNVRARLLTLLPRGVLSKGRSGAWAGYHYLNVGHTGLDRNGHGEWIERTGVQAIYFLHDLIPLTHPEYCRPGEPEKHLRRMNALLSHGTGVIANSQDTLNELAVFAASRKALKMPPSLAAPLGVAMHGGRCPVGSVELPSRRPYFIMLGTIEGRKNHLLILNIWAELARRLGPVCPQLMIIGQRGWECEQAVDMLDRCEALHGNVVELSHCDDALLVSYMSNARALLFPSFVEGYGLPLVEALACGTPVVASDLAVFRELAGAIPDYLNPIDGVGWMKCIENYAKDNSDLRAAQLRRLSGWLPPSWQGHFDRVDHWLESLLSGGHSRRPMTDPVVHQALNR